MNVAELIAKLQKMPQDARLVIDGYEYGLEDLDPDAVRLIPVMIDWNKECGGPHEEWSERICRPPDEFAVYIW